MERNIEIFFEGLDFGEGPRWHDGRLWVSDFFQHRVRSIGPTGDVRIEAEIDDQPSGLGWLPSGDLLVVAMKSRQVRRVDSDGNVHLHGDVSTVAEHPCNDMVVSASGNAYVGNFGFDTHAENPVPGPGPLALVRPDGTVEVAATDMMVSNGSVITPDGRTLIVGESLGARYSAFTIQDDGTLTDRRVWAQLEGMAPDGCALDAEGAIWMADAFGGSCVRIAEGGEVLDRISTSQPIFACTLGGEDRQTLYLVTAPSFSEDVCGGKAQGRIEALRVDVPGAGLP